MRKYNVYISSGIVSAIWLLLTGWISFGHQISHLFEFFALFHIIPWAIGFSEGTTIWFYLSYLFTWIVLSLLFIPIVKKYCSSKYKKLILTFTVGPITFLLLFGFYADYKESKNRESLIAANYKKDKADFYQLKTGDLLFQTINNDPIPTDSQNSNTIYNNIGIAFIDGQNYVLLATTYQVQYVSLRQWVKNGIDEKYVVKRLRNADSLFTNVENQKLELEVRNNIMKKYDTNFDWSDEKIYNAELIWKIYKRSLNIELGKLDTIRVDSIMKYEITPKTIFDSKNLITVKKE